MAEIALFENAHDGVSKTRKGVKIRKAPTPKTWEVTVKKPAKPDSCFDHWSKNTGPFPPDGNWHKLAEVRGKNCGDAKGDFMMVFAELDKDGNELRKITAAPNFDLSPGVCFAANNPDGNTNPITDDSDCSKVGELYDKKSEAGTYYYGVKVWCTEEGEPEWPSPTAAIYEKKVSYPSWIPQLEPWQWAMIGGGTLVGIGIGYVCIQGSAVAV